MAFANKAALIAALEVKFGPGNVEVDDTPLPTADGDLSTVTRHRIRYLDESGNSGNMLAATAIQKENGTWITVNEVPANNVRKDALVAWVDNAARPWAKVTEIRHIHARDSAKIEAVFTGPLRVEVHLVAFVGASYASMKLADGPFPI